MKDTGPDAWAIGTYREVDPEFGDEPFPTNHALKAQALRDGCLLLSNDGDSVIVAPLSVNREPTPYNKSESELDAASTRTILAPGANA